MRCFLILYAYKLFYIGLIGQRRGCFPFTPSLCTLAQSRGRWEERPMGRVVLPLMIPLIIFAWRFAVTRRMIRRAHFLLASSGLDLLRRSFNGKSFWGGFYFLAKRPAMGNCCCGGVCGAFESSLAFHRQSLGKGDEAQRFYPNHPSIDHLWKPGEAVKAFLQVKIFMILKISQSTGLCFFWFSCCCRQYFGEGVLSLFG